MKKKIYLTDNTEEINARTRGREKKYRPNLEQEWKDLDTKLIITREGEEILKIDNFEVMASFQTPYMKKLAEIVSDNGGNILNVGFGLGLADTFIESLRVEKGINEHHIIELNSQIFSSAKDWKKKQTFDKNIILHQGNWKKVISKFSNPFDGILYDAFPLKKDDLCRDFIPFLEVVINKKIIKEDKGIVTFFFDSSDGFGRDFIKLAKKLGVKEMKYEKVDIDLPKSRESETWQKPYFLAPILTRIKL